MDGAADRGLAWEVGWVAGSGARSGALRAALLRRLGAGDDEAAERRLNGLAGAAYARLADGVAAELGMPAPRVRVGRRTAAGREVVSSPAAVSAVIAEQAAHLKGCGCGSGPSLVRWLGWCGRPRVALPRWVEIGAWEEPEAVACGAELDRLEAAVRAALRRLG